MAEEKSEKTIKIKIPSMRKIDVWRILTMVFAAIILAQLFGFFNLTGLLGLPASSQLSSQQVGEKVIEYINQNLVQPGATASLVSVNDKGSFYEVVTSYQGNRISVYASKDGKYILSGGGICSPIDMSQQLSRKEAEEEQPQEIPKTDKPVVELYVMSFCPYGNRAENTMWPVYKLLKDKVEWKIYYIVSVSDSTVSSLHGQPEVDEDEREACVLAEYGLDKWWEFTVYVNDNCGIRGECWEEAANRTGVDVNKIRECISKKGLDLMKESETAANKANARGSPTLIINGVKSNAVYQYGNSEAYKQAICQAFKSPPTECSQVLGSSSSGTSGGRC